MSYYSMEHLPEEKVPAIESLREYLEDVKTGRYNTSTGAITPSQIPGKLQDVVEFLGKAVLSPVMEGNREGIEKAKKGDYLGALSDIGIGHGLGAFEWAMPFLRAAKPAERMLGGPAVRRALDFGDTLDGDLMAGGIRTLGKSLPVTAPLAASTIPSDTEANPTKWFSPIVKALLESPQKKATGQQWLKYIEKNVPGSSDELEFTIGPGLRDFKDRPITLDELLSYAEDNKLEIEKSILRDEPTHPYVKELAKKHDVEFLMQHDEGFAGWEPEYELKSNIDNYLTKADHYSRERLDTTKQMIDEDYFPDNFEEILEEALDERKNFHNFYTEARNLYPGITAHANPAYRFSGPFGTKEYRETVLKSPQTFSGGDFDGGHYRKAIPRAKEEIGTYRSQLVETNDGKRVWFNDEFQSDAHQRGSKQGYGQDSPFTKYDVKEKEYTLDTLPPENDKNFVIREIEDLIEKGRRSPDDPITVLEYGDGKTALSLDPSQVSNHKEEIVNFLNRNSPDQYRVSNRPGKKERWIERAFNSSVFDAAHEEADYVGWATSKDQVKRYSDKSRKLYEKVYDKKVPAAAKKMGKWLYGDDWEKNITTVKLKGESALEGEDARIEAFRNFQKPITLENEETLSAFEEMTGRIRKVLEEPDLEPDDKSQLKHLEKYLTRVLESEDGYIHPEVLVDEIEDIYPLWTEDVRVFIEKMIFVHNIVPEQAPSRKVLKLTPEARKKILKEGVPLGILSSAGLKGVAEDKD